MDPLMIIAATCIVGLAIVALAALQGWRDWVAL